MSKLLARLSDPSSATVCRVAHDRDVKDCLRGAPLALSVINLHGGKAGMLAAFARALAFPKGFGGNWDALEDCLRDLSWRANGGEVLLLEGAHPGADLEVLTEVLQSSVEFWRGRDRPFWAVFLDPEARLALPALYRESRGR